MRQLKFRGKNSHGKWFFGGITLDKKYIVDKFTFQMVRPETIGQFTGFYDESNTEIFEGDVIQVEEMPYIIEWNEKKGRFNAKNNLLSITLSNAYICNVIGNIHDDPKLFPKLQSEFLKSVR